MFNKILWKFSGVIINTTDIKTYHKVNEFKCISFNEKGMGAAQSLCLFATEALWQVKQ